MNLRTRTPLFLTSAIVSLVSCTGEPAPLAVREATAGEAFWDALSSHCWSAYSGAITSEDARDADWQGRAMVAHWAECSDEQIAIAFHIADPEAEGGWDRSRTWIITREIYENGSGPITLKHDHRHADGEPDAVTFYGGSVTPGDPGTAEAQDFPVDQESIDLFTREGLDASLTNVWRLEVEHAEVGDARITYQLTRENDPTRLFRVTFNAANPVAPPPPAWGWE